MGEKHNSGQEEQQWEEEQQWVRSVTHQVFCSTWWSNFEQFTQPGEAQPEKTTLHTSTQLKNVRSNHKRTR
jgi:hypothetical protein